MRLGEGPDAAIALRSTGSTDGGDIVSSIMARDGELTMLELFQALAPDESPPPALVESHLDAVAAMGRADSRVREVEKVLPPPGVSPCEPSLFFFPPLTWTNQVITATTFDSYLCVTEEPPEADRGIPTEDSCSFFTSDRMMAGACVSANQPAPIRVLAGFGVEGGSWNLTESIDVPLGEFERLDFEQSSTRRRLAVVGFTSNTGTVMGLRSGVGH